MPRSVMMPAVLAVAMLPGATQARAQAQAQAEAQRVQITPFAGYAFGGAVRSSVTGEEYSFDASLAYGGTLSFAISQSWRFELLYSRQETRLGGDGPSPSFDVTIERYLAGFQEEKGEGSVRYFGTFWLGANRFVPGLAGIGAETRFGGGVGLGVKTFPAKNVGLRFEARGFYTLVKSEGGAFCANGECLFVFAGSGLWQGDVSAGLILAF